MNGSPASNLAQSATSRATWVVAGVAMFWGGVGGFAHSLLPTSKGALALPWYAQLIIGAAAAVAALWLILPDIGARLFAVSVVAGWMGPMLLDDVATRISKAVADRDVTFAAEEGAKAADLGAELAAGAARLKKALENVAIENPTAKKALKEFVQPATDFKAQQKELEDISKRLKQLKQKYAED
jgi:hypothetical protein